MTATGDDPIDWEQLDAMTDGDREFGTEMIDFFLQNAVGYLADLESQDSEDGWRKAAHKLKGAAQSIGARHVGAAALKAEKLGAEGFESGRAAACQDIREGLSRLRAFREA